MQISFYSLLMTVVWSSVFIIILVLLRKYVKGRAYFGIGPLTVLLVGCIFRCVLPLDFPGFTKPISSTSIYAAINTRLYTPFIEFGGPGKGITPLMVFFAVWIAVFVCMFGHFLWNHCKNVHALIHIYQEVDSGPIYEEALKISKQLHIKKFKIVMDESIPGPRVCGFLYPRIKLPETEYTPERLRYILMHEFGHWKNGDMWLRLLTNMICYLFWWNPIVYLLFYRLDISLEFKCDGSLIAAGCLSEDERAAYLDAIDFAIENRRKQKRLARLFSVEADFFDTYSKIDFQERLDIIGDYVPDKKKERLITIFSVAFTVVLIVFSYRYILQPYYYEPETEYSLAGGNELSSENMYLVKNSDGMYSVYIDDQLYMSLTPENAKIFIDSDIEVREE